MSAPNTDGVEPAMTRHGQFTAEQRARLERYVAWNLRIGNDSDQVVDTAALLAHADAMAGALERAQEIRDGENPASFAVRHNVWLICSQRPALASHPRKEPT